MEGAPEPPGLSHGEIYDHPPFEDAGWSGGGTIDQILRNAETEQLASLAHPMAKDILVRYR